MRAAFMMVPHDLFRTTALSAHDKLVLLAIIDVGRSDMPDRWNVLPMERMIRHTGLSRTACYTATKRLIDLGVLAVEKRHLQAPKYRVQWAALDALVDAAEALQDVSCVPNADSFVPNTDSCVPNADSCVPNTDSRVPSTRDDAGEYKSKRRSSKEKSLQQPSSPRSNEWDDTCLLCSQFVAAGSGRLIGSEAAHRDGECPAQVEWD